MRERDKGAFLRQPKQTMGPSQFARRGHPRHASREIDEQETHIGELCNLGHARVARAESEAISFGEASLL